MKSGFESLSLAKVKTLFSLMWLKIVVTERNFIEWLKVAFKYYRSWPFMKVDLALLSLYAFRSPFDISKRFLTARGEQDVHAYGETPLTALDDISKQCGIRPTDVVFELGCGRGRSCFWMRQFLGCQVVGIEWVPTFIQNAEKVKGFLGKDGVQFRLEDMTSSNLTGATVVYLYGTCLDDKTIHKLIQKFEKLPSGTKIITISYALSDYTDKPLFEVMKLFPAQFTWGVGDVYVQYRK